MPKLDWLTRPEDERAAASVPYRLLEAVPDLSYGDEQTEKGFNRDVIEKALSHEKQGIRAVYILAEHAPERKRMLQWWADYVDSIVNEFKVIVGNFGGIA